MKKEVGMTFIVLMVAVVAVMVYLYADGTLTGAAFGKPARDSNYCSLDGSARYGYSIDGCCRAASKKNHCYMEGQVLKCSDGAGDLKVLSFSWTDNTGWMYYNTAMISGDMSKVPGICRDNGFVLIWP